MVQIKWEALVDDGCAKLIETAGALTVVEGMCDGQPTRMALTDRSISGGSFGVAECDALSRQLSRSIEDRVAIVLVLDSTGARLDTGLAGLAAFRKMYRTALNARLSGVPMVAILWRNCCGGASMLAMLCEKRAAMRSARLGMSGPGIVETLSGKGDLDSSNATQVRALFGAATRAEAGALDHLVEDQNSLRDVLSRMLRSSSRKLPELASQHDRLLERLRHAGLSSNEKSKKPDGSEAFRTGQPVGARDIWLLANDVLDSSADATIKLNIDCPGQAATQIDEQMVLSEYVAHLAMCMRAHCIRGGKIVVRILGESAGGIYVALASGADRVEAESGATVRLLPVAAVQAVLGRSLPAETLADALANGVVDHVISEFDESVDAKK